VLNCYKILEFFGYNPGPVAALDISNTAVKILQLSRLGTIITIDHYAIEPLNNIDATSVIKAIKAVILKSGVKAKKISIAIPHEKIITKIIRMPAVLSDKDMGNEIELEASKYIPYPIADMSIDYMVLKPQQNNSDTVDVLLVASKSAYVHDITSLVIAAGLQPVIVDVDTYAIARAFEFVTKNSLTANCNKIFAIFDLVSNNISINIVRNGYVIYVRDQAFDEPCQLTIEQQLVSLYKTVITMGLFEAVDGIYLTGSKSNIKDLDIIIENILQVKTFKLNVFSNMLLSTNISQTEFAYDSLSLTKCSGLALRNIMN